MNATDRRRIHERAAILMITKNMDPTRAIVEAARQLGLTGESPPFQTPASQKAIAKKRRS